MDELIVRFLSGEATAEEVRQLEGWRAASPDHERQFAEFARVWRAADAPPPRPIAAPPPVSAIVAEAERRRGSVVSLAERRAQRAKRWRRLVPLTAAAAAATIVIAVGLPMFQVSERFATAAGEQQTVSLADGSVVRLGPGSSLEVRGTSARTVRLDGQAFFAVASDSARPFTVEHESGHVQVLGTRFEVAASPDSLRLVVVEGRVALTAAGERVEVVAGHVSRVTAGAAPSAPSPEDVWSLLDWPGGLLIFQATPLAEALAEIERHFGVEVTLADGALGERTVTAWFEDEPVIEVVETVCTLVAASCAVSPVAELVP